MTSRGFRFAISSIAAALSSIPAWRLVSDSESSSSSDSSDSISVSSYSVSFSDSESSSSSATVKPNNILFLSLPVSILVRTSSRVNTPSSVSIVSLLPSANSSIITASMLRPVASPSSNSS